MRIGVIAEGRGDLAVLTNIFKGQLGLDSEDIQYLRPEYSLDETETPLPQPTRRRLSTRLSGSQAA
jgi:hypothetical protein